MADLLMDHLDSRRPGDGGNDTIDVRESANGARGTDTVNAGGGNDTINARDGELDRINCGKGRDTVYYDLGGIDTVKACERKTPDLSQTPPPALARCPAPVALPGRTEQRNPVCRARARRQAAP